jgi:DNA polymerase III delta prime subunit
MKFTKAERSDSYIKLALTGPSGSGKSYSALKLARGLVGPNGKIAVVDTENGSSKLYSDLTEFYHADLAAPFHYQKFIEAVKEAEKAGFDCVVIDSLSHLWTGILDEKNNIDRRGGNQYTNWTEPTKHLNEAIQTILQSKIHVIACMRSKQEYTIQEEVNSKGKTISVPKKIGTAPVMREGIDYEFSTVLEIGMDHQATPSKDRTGLFVDKTFQIDETTGEQIASWLKNTPTLEPVDQEPSDSDNDNDTAHFLRLIHEADSRETLGRIGLAIKESELPETAKATIRTVYKERFNSLTTV